jgi:hypothetical protein
LLQQFCTAQDERAHQDFAQLRVGLHECEDIVASDFDNVSILPRTNPRGRTASLKRGEFTGESPWPEDPYERFLAKRRTHCL